MAKELLLRRGTTAENNLFTGALAELSYDTDRKEVRIHDGSTVGGKVLSIATGVIVPYGGTVAPEGYLICDGSAISRTNYPELFAAIGTKYGAGDGSTTFNIPNYSSVKFITSSGNIGVKGTGKALGISTNGADSRALATWSNYAGYGNDGTSGSNIGAAISCGSGIVADRAVGVVTDSSKSGLITTINAAISSVFIIKY